MKLSMFKGLCPVRIPDNWCSDFDTIRFAHDGGTQYIDFTSNGGKAYGFSVSVDKPYAGIVPASQSEVQPHYWEVNPDEIQEWGDANNAIHVEQYKHALMFGMSDRLIELS